jgi:propanol-preferring alcohol dehydrogenase
VSCPAGRFDAEEATGLKAMLLDRAGEKLRLAEVPMPEPGAGQILAKVRACGVCRTDLHVVDGDLTEPKLPIVPGHEIVGVVARLGEGVERFREGDRIGIPWRFTGYQIDGGYAEYTVADARYCFPIHGPYDDAEAAPLLCAGLIGYRSLRMAGDGERLGIYGFGAAAHIVAQVARHQGRRVFAFTRAGDRQAQEFARDLGAEWAGSSDERPPEELDAAIIFAPAGPLIPTALQAVAKGGVVVAGGIHMSDIPSFPYRILWGERVVRSVANLTREDAEEFLELAPKVPVETAIQRFSLADANLALAALREGRLRGAAVLVPG